MIAMVVSLTGLIVITPLAYRNAPSIPELVVDAQGVCLYTGNEIKEDQAIFMEDQTNFTLDRLLNATCRSVSGYRYGCHVT